MAEPWYKVAEPNEPLKQGDLVYSCPILVPPADFDLTCKPKKRILVKCRRYDVVVMSQSCDVAPDDHLEFVTVCPFDTLPNYFVSSSSMHDRGSIDRIRQRFNYKFHLLNKCRLVDEESKEIQYETDYLLVDFRFTYSVPYDVLIRVAKKNKRVHLESPFREHLSQAFGWYYVRVALEDEIPEFTKDRYDFLDIGWQDAMKQIEASMRAQNSTTKSNVT